MGFRKTTSAAPGPRRQPDAKSHAARLSAREIARSPDGYASVEHAIEALSESGFERTEAPESAAAAMRDRRRKVRALLSRDGDSRYRWAFFADEE